MGIQELIAIVLVAAAALFAGGVFLGKLRSFSPKTSCGSDCGCDSTTKKQNTPA